MGLLATWGKLLLSVISLVVLLWFFPGANNDDRAKSRGTKNLAGRTHPHSGGGRFSYCSTQSGLTITLRYFSLR